MISEEEHQRDLDELDKQIERRAARITRRRERLAVLSNDFDTHSTHAQESLWRMQEICDGLTN